MDKSIIDHNGFKYDFTALICEESAEKAMEKAGHLIKSGEKEKAIAMIVSWNVNYRAIKDFTSVADGMHSCYDKFLEHKKNG